MPGLQAAADFLGVREGSHRVAGRPGSGLDPAVLARAAHAGRPSAAPGQRPLLAPRGRGAASAQDRLRDGDLSPELPAAHQGRRGLGALGRPDGFDQGCLQPADHRAGVPAGDASELSGHTSVRPVVGGLVAVAGRHRAVGAGTGTAGRGLRGAGAAAGRGGRHPGDRNGRQVHPDRDGRGTGQASSAAAATPLSVWLPTASWSRTAAAAGFPETPPPRGQEQKWSGGDGGGHVHAPPGGAAMVRSTKKSGPAMPRGCR